MRLHMMAEVIPGIAPAQYEREFNSLVKIYRQLKPVYVVEIGSWKGGTLWHWLKNTRRGAHVVSVNFSPELWGPPEPEFDNRIWNEWAPEGVTLHTITGNSRHKRVISQVAAICPHIDFLFIDGDHSYEGIKADWENYSGMVKHGGVVAMHDLIAPAGRERIQVGKFFKELKEVGHKTEELYSVPAGQKRMGIGVIYV